MHEGARHQDREQQLGAEIVLRRLMILSGPRRFSSEGAAREIVEGVEDVEPYESIVVV
jgi:hypothetical protein